MDIPYRLGYIRDPKDDRDYQINDVLSRAKKSEEKKINYKREMSPVKEQGQKSACVGFAVAAVLEWQQQQEYLNERKKGSSYKREKEHYDLSEQWIYHRAKEIDNWPDQEGTSIRHALKIVNKHGVPTENGWPYSDMMIGKPKFWAFSTARWNKNKSYYRINNVDELVDTLNNIGPCIIGILVYPELINPNKKGFVSYPQHTSNSSGGHALCAVGFNIKKKKIIIKNSWGTSWGKNGYGALPFEYINDFMLDAWVTIDNTKIAELST